MARRVSISRPGREAVDRGALAVEFALLLPVLLTILFGILDMGTAFQKWSVTSNAAREGARRAATSRDTGEITSRAMGAAHALDPARVSVTVTCSHDGAAFAACADGPSWAAGDVVRVQVAYRRTFVTPVGEFVEHGPDITMRATSEARFEG